MLIDELCRDLLLLGSRDLIISPSSKDLEEATRYISPTLMDLVAAYWSSRMAGRLSITPFHHIYHCPGKSNVEQDNAAPPCKVSYARYLVVSSWLTSR